MPIASNAGATAPSSAAFTASRSAAPSLAKACSAAARDASKVALVHLVARLIAGGYQLLDTQFQTDHLARFGVIEMARNRYLHHLNRAVKVEADFYSLPNSAPPSDWLSLIRRGFVFERRFDQAILRR